jgi:hypothetical protein
MSDEPTNPIATRAQRYPEQTEEDAVQAVARAAVAAVPVIGGTITELLSLVLAPAVERRKRFRGQTEQCVGEKYSSTYSQ